VDNRVHTPVIVGRHSHCYLLFILAQSKNKPHCEGSIDTDGLTVRWSDDTDSPTVRWSIDTDSLTVRETLILAAPP